MIHHIHAFQIHVTVLILLKGFLFARNSRLIPDKANWASGSLRWSWTGGTCKYQVGTMCSCLFWMFNTIAIAVYHFSWKMQSDVWGTIDADGNIAHITGGNFAQSANTINGWLRDFQWAQAAQVISPTGHRSQLILFLGAHFVWAFSLMFLFSGRGYWQELIESIVWAHNKLKVAPSVQPRALVLFRVGLWGASFLLEQSSLWAFFEARIISVG